MTRFLTLVLASLCLSVPALAGAGMMFITNETAYETAPGMTAGAAFMTISMPGGDRLTGASSPICESVEIHSMTEDDGIMRMRKEEGLDISATDGLTLAPNGNHLMLLGLKEPLKAGTEFPITLTFKNSPPTTVNIKVKSRSAEAHDAEHPITIKQVPFAH